MNSTDWDRPLPQRALWVAGHRFDSSPHPIQRHRHARLTIYEFLLLSAALLALLLL